MDTENVIIGLAIVGVIAYFYYEYQAQAAANAAGQTFVGSAEQFGQNLLQSAESVFSTF
jgi:hypothetical protein